MKKFLFELLPLFCLMSLTGFSPAQTKVNNSLSVTYLANSGFLITYGNKNILIDALYKESYGKYDPPSQELISGMKNGDSPFEKIDLFLVTHKHGDHFYAPYVKDFLEHHPETILVSSKDVCDQCGAEDNIKDRVNDIPLDVGESVDTVINGVTLKVLRLIHFMDSTGYKIINLGFIIKTGDMNVFHPGDITVEWDSALFDRLEIGKEKIDVMFVPYFDLSDSSQIYINDIVRPEYIIAMHIPPEDIKTEAKKFREAFPGAIVFEKESETHAFGINRSEKIK